METTVLQIDTGGPSAVVDITGQIDDFCTAKGDGLLSVFAPHATAGIAIIETGAGSEDDLVALLETLIPHDDRWRHRHGSVGHGADHVLPAVVSPSVVVPVIDGRPALGTWQSIVLVDTNRDNPERQVRLSFLPDASASSGES